MNSLANNHIFRQTKPRAYHQQTLIIQITFVQEENDPRWKNWKARIMVTPHKRWQPNKWLTNKWKLFNLTIHQKYTNKITMWYHSLIHRMAKIFNDVSKNAEPAGLNTFIKINWYTAPLNNCSATPIEAEHIYVFRNFTLRYITTFTDIYVWWKTLMGFYS